MRTFRILMDMAMNPRLLGTVCSRVALTEDPARTVWEATAGVEKAFKNGPVCFKNVPTYIMPEHGGAEQVQSRSIPSVNAYTIDLHGISDIDQYMTQHFSKKNRGNILRGIRRLEDCFKITYTRYFGEIEEQECHHLAALLKEMILARFEERNETSHTLSDWDEIQSTLYPLILGKQASLLVLKHEDKPVCISISYHYNELFFYFISSFDITYSKFSIGNIMLYKQLEWSVANNYLFFEMGWGDLDYKRRWSNRVEPLINYFIYPGKGSGAPIRVHFEVLKSRLIAYLISKKVNLLYRRVRNLVRGNKTSFVPVIYELEEVEHLLSAESSNLVNTELAGNAHLKTILNDYLYSSQENYREVYIMAKGNEYYIQGRNGWKRINFRSGLQK